MKKQYLILAILLINITNLTSYGQSLSFADLLFSVEKMSNFGEIKKRMQKVGFSLFEENSLEKSMTFKNPSNQSEILHIGPDYFQYEFPDKENDGLKLWFNNYFTIPNIKFIGAYQQNIPEYNRAWLKYSPYLGQHLFKIKKHLVVFYS